MKSFLLYACIFFSIVNSICKAAERTPMQELVTRLQKLNEWYEPILRTEDRTSLYDQYRNNWTPRLEQRIENIQKTPQEILVLFKNDPTGDAALKRLLDEVLDMIFVERDPKPVIGPTHRPNAIDDKFDRRDIRLNQSYRKN